MLWRMSTMVCASNACVSSRHPVDLPRETAGGCTGEFALSDQAGALNDSYDGMRPAVLRIGQHCGIRVWECLTTAWRLLPH